MNEPIVSAPSTRDRFIRRLLFIGWWGVMTLLPIGHLTGLRNTATTIVVLATLLWAGKDCWRALPARWWAVSILAWCAASIGWSAVPEVSFGKWRSDLLLPLLAYATAFGYVKKTQSIDAIVGGIVTGIVCLTVLSIPALLPGAWANGLAMLMRTESFATVVNPMPVWFPGVGDASIAAAFASVGLILTGPWVASRQRRLAIAVTVLFVSSIVLILVAINNRNATLTIPVAAGFAVWLDRRRSNAPQASAPGARSRISRIVPVAVLVIVVSGSLALLESGARERLRQTGMPVGDDQSALLVLTERDTRPMIWSYYTRLALRAPWSGVGFGRTVPGITYHTQADLQLALVEGNAYVHAHNLVLNWWLQTGLVGVALLLGLLSSLVASAWRSIGRVGTARRAATSTVIALVTTMLLRNMTDDLLIFGMASMFWILVGMCFAAAGLSSDSRSTRTTGQREP